jgi:LysM repeat protein
MNDIRSLIEKLEEINESTEVEKAIKRGVDQLSANPTIADIEAGANNAAKEIRAQLQSRDDDSFFQGIGRGAMRFGTSVDYIKSQFLGYTAQKLKLPGLYSMPDGKSFVTSDKDGLRFKVVRFADMNDAAKLYQAGYVTPAKAKELQVQNTNNPAFKEPPGPKKTAEPSVPGVVPAPGGKDGTPTDANGVQVNPIAEPVNTSQTSVNNYTSKKLTSADINNLNQFKTDEITKELMNELRKLLNILKDSKLNFKSDIALRLVESDRLYERELSASDEEKLRIVIYNLKLLEPKASPVVKALLGNYLETVPKKYFSTLPAPAAPTTAPTATAPAATEPAATEPADGVKRDPAKKITWQDLAKLNPQIKNPNLIYPGQEIKLPNGSSAIVDQGDTLGSLAQRYNQGGYDDFDDETPAPAAPTTAPAPAAPTTAPAAAAPTLKPAEAAAISVKIKTALRNFRNQDSLDRIWMDIKSKENFNAIDAQFRTTGKKGIVDAVNSEWGYNKNKQFIPMLKRLGIATK